MQSFIIGNDGASCVALDEFTREELCRGQSAQVLVAAVERAGPGGRVRLMPGEYSVAQPLVLPEAFNLVGSGRGTVIRDDDGFSGQSLLSACGIQQVVVADLTVAPREVDGVDYGIVLSDSGDCAVQGVFAVGFAISGIRMEAHCFMCRIENCVTANNGVSGLVVARAAHGGRGGDYVPTNVIGCTSYGERGSGFELNHALCVNFTGCQVFQAAKHGFWIHDTSNSTCLSGCRAFECIGSGVLVKDSHEINISSSILCWNLGHGIELDHAIWGTVSANNVIDSGGVQGESVHGIYLHTDCRSIHVGCNAVFSWDGHIPMLAGIYEHDDCRDNSFVGNNINWCREEAGVVFRGKNSLALSNAVRPEAHDHPEKEPFVVRDRRPTPAEFTLDRIKRFVSQVHRVNAAATSGNVGKG